MISNYRVQLCNWLAQAHDLMGGVLTVVWPHCFAAPAEPSSPTRTVKFT
jgi:hypothetical protein